MGKVQQLPWANEKSFSQIWVKTKTLIGNTWVKSISQIKFCQFATASFNCGQLQTILFKDGLYRKAPVNFSTFRNVWMNYKRFIQIWIKSFGYILTTLMKFEQIGTTSPNLGEVKNVSTNWKNLGKFLQTKSTLAK